MEPSYPLVALVRTTKQRQMYVFRRPGSVSQLTLGNSRPARRKWPLVADSIDYGELNDRRTRKEGYDQRMRLGCGDTESVAWQINPCGCGSQPYIPSKMSSAVQSIPLHLAARNKTVDVPNSLVDPPVGHMQATMARMVLATIDFSFTPQSMSLAIAGLRMKGKG